MYTSHYGHHVNLHTNQTTDHQHALPLPQLRCERCVSGPHMIATSRCRRKKIFLLQRQSCTEYCADASRRTGEKYAVALGQLLQRAGKYRSVSVRLERDTTMHHVSNTTRILVVSPTQDLSPQISFKPVDQAQFYMPCAHYWLVPC